jgi:hypothetical protein
VQKWQLSYVKICQLKRPLPKCLVKKAQGKLLLFLLGAKKNRFCPESKPIKYSCNSEDAKKCDLGENLGSGKLKGPQ